jgi:hypothetical protein
MGEKWAAAGSTQMDADKSSRICSRVDVTVVLGRLETSDYKLFSDNRLW